MLAPRPLSASLASEHSKMKSTLPSFVGRFIDRVFRRRAADLVDPVARTREAYLAYLDAKRRWLLHLEACTLKDHLDLDFAVRNRFRLQLLYDERTALRLAILLRQDSARFESLKSLSEISQRVDKNWNDADNAAACIEDQMYRDIDEQISYLRTLENPSIGAPLAAVEKTSEYTQALRLLQKKMRAIDASLKNNAT